jgi:hypothetical protein
VVVLWSGSNSMGPHPASAPRRPKILSTPPQPFGLAARFLLWAEARHAVGVHRGQHRKPRNGPYPEFWPDGVDFDLMNARNGGTPKDPDAGKGLVFPQTQPPAPEGSPDATPVGG